MCSFLYKEQKSDEHLLVYQLYYSHKSQQLHVYGVIYEDNLFGGPTKQKALKEYLQSRTYTNNAEIVESHFQDVVKWFFIDMESFKHIVFDIYLNGIEFHRFTCKSHLNGYFHGTCHLDYDKILGGRVSIKNWGNIYNCQIPHNKVQYIVISDIDDTIKDSQVLDKLELLRNTFFRPFKAVAGMAERYRELQSVHGDAIRFFYVSSSPVQLYAPLKRFLTNAAFPDGPILLRKLVPSSISSIINFVGGQDSYTHKVTQITTLVNDWASATSGCAKFILIGDSGERDAMIYSEMARKYSQNIYKIFIRNLNNMVEAKYHSYLFKDPKEIKI